MKRQLEGASKVPTSQVNSNLERAQLDGLVYSGLDKVYAVQCVKCVHAQFASYKLQIIQTNKSSKLVEVSLFEGLHKAWVSVV